MTNPFLGLWLSGADAWMGAARGLCFAEVQRQQARMLHEIGEQAIRLWGGAWMVPAPERRPVAERRAAPSPRPEGRPVTERMAALSLRVVEGGRR